MFAMELICRKFTISQPTYQMDKIHLNTFSHRNRGFAPRQHKVHGIVCTFKNRNRIVNLNVCIKWWCRMKVQKTHYIANCGVFAMEFGVLVQCMCIVCSWFHISLVWQVLNSMFKLFGTKTIINIASTHNNKMGLLVHVLPLVIVWYTIIFKLLYVLNGQNALSVGAMWPVFAIIFRFRYKSTINIYTCTRHTHRHTNNWVWLAVRNSQ